MFVFLELCSGSLYTYNRFFWRNKQFHPLFSLTNRNWTKAVTGHTEDGHIKQSLATQGMATSNQGFKSDSCFPSEHIARVLPLFPSNCTRQKSHPAVAWVPVYATKWNRVHSILLTQRASAVGAESYFSLKLDLEMSEFQGQGIWSLFSWQYLHKLSCDWRKV